MPQHLRRDREGARRRGRQRGRSVPPLGQRVPQELRRLRPPLELQGPDDPAEGRIGRVEQAVHLRRQSRRDIVVVRLRQDVPAAGEAHVAVTHGRRGVDAEIAPHGVVGGGLGLRHARGRDGGRRREPVRRAPPLQREGGTVVAEEIGVQGLDQRQGLEPRRTVIGPGGCGRRRRRQAHDGEQRTAEPRHRALTVSFYVPGSRRRESPPSRRRNWP